jgi:hypothetical protein
MRRRLSLFGLLAAVAALLSADGSAADPYPVTTVTDSGNGSLRAAITAANGHGGADRIPIETTGTIELATALPPVNTDIEIVGPGPNSLTIERPGGAPGFGIFLFTTGTTSTLSGVTVKGGLTFSGGGIVNSHGNLTLVRVVVTDNEAIATGGGTSFAGGGGIFSNGSLTLRESWIHGNEATARGGAENSAGGGGIESEGPLTIERSTISENTAWAGAEGGTEALANGGGLALNGGSTTIVDSTISDNAVYASEATGTNAARGGGVQGTASAITGSTIAGNEADAEGPGGSLEFASGANLSVPSGTTIRDSIVAAPQGGPSSCGSQLSSGGFNLDEDGSCDLSQSSDLVAKAGLDSNLEFAGGPTPTHGLLANSAAIDRGKSFGSSVDQRGLPRPSDFPAISNSEGGDGSDIGAFELQVPAPGPGPVLVTEVPADRQPPNTRIVKGPARDSYEREAKFRFASTEAQSSFQCKVDKGRWKGCRNPYKRTVKPGKHVFKVRAIDRFGNVDPTPARFGWRVKPIRG